MSRCIRSAVKFVDGNGVLLALLDIEHADRVLPRHAPSACVPPRMGMAVPASESPIRRLKNSRIG